MSRFEYKTLQILGRTCLLAAAMAIAAPASGDGVEDEEIPLTPLVDEEVPPEEPADTSDEELPITPLVEDESDTGEQPPTEAEEKEGRASFEEHIPAAEPAPSGAPHRPTLLPGIRAALLVPTSQINLTGSVALELQWRSSVHDRRLGLSLDVGWYRLAGEGSQIDPAMGVFDYYWSAHGIPVHLGLVYEPPVQALLAPLLPGLWPFVESGMALVPAISYGTFMNENGHVFLEDNPGYGLAFGLYLGAGAAHPLGPGEITALYRWTTAYTDMNYPWINPEAGDIHGSQVFVGYRLTY